MANKDIRELYANTSTSIGGTSSDTIMTPAGTKSVVDSRKADNSTVVTGTDDAKFVTPKGLKDNYIIKTGGSYTGAITIGSTDAPTRELEVYALGGDSDVRVRLFPATGNYVDLGSTTTQSFIDSGTGKSFAIFTGGSSRFAISSTGVTTFTARPTFNGNLAWDAGNFTPGNYAPLAGATFTGNVLRSGAVGTDRAFGASTGANLRWTWGAGNSAEAGADAGSNFFINSYTDGGVYKATVAFFTRDTGALTLSTRPNWGSTPWDNGNFDPATKASLSGAIFTGSIVVRSNPTVGRVDMVSGDANAPGYVAFFDETQARVGYIGYEPATNKIGIWAESPFTGYRFNARPEFGSYTPWDNGNLPSPVSEAPNDGSTYARRSAAWVKSVGGAIVSDVAPSTPEAGQKWFNSASGDEYIWYVDTDGGQWVQTSTEGVADAPYDGKDYVRNNGVWSLNPVQRLDSKSITNAAALEFDLPTTGYSRFSLDIQELVSITNPSYPALQFRYAGVWSTTNHRWRMVYWNTASGAPATWSDAGTGTYVFGMIISATTAHSGGPIEGTVDIYPGGTSVGTTRADLSQAGTGYQVHGYHYTNTTRADGIRIIANAGNLASAKATLWGRI